MLRELVENIFLRIKLWKKILYAAKFFSLPGSGNVKCDYEEVIEHEQK